MGLKVFIAGATGVLGRRLVSQFRARRHEVAGLARTPENETTIRALGGEPKRVDLFDAASLARAAKDSDVIIRAATAIPRTMRFRLRDWAMNDRIRRDGTRALTEAAGRVGARMYLQEGIVWVAQPPDGSAFDESSPLSPRLWYQSAVDSETIAREAGDRQGFEVATLRFGAFYGADSAQTRQMAERAARGRLPILGRGDAMWSSIHLDDAASAAVAVTEGGRGGLWHVVDDRPATMTDFFTALARVLGAPTPRRIPLWLATLALGGPTVGFLTASTRTSNTRIRRDFGWTPQFPTIEEGLREVADAWKAEGFPPR